MSQKSLIVQALEDNRSDANWMKCFGILSLPCCCIGLSCIGISTLSTNFANKYESVIKLYGGREICDLIKIKVDNEIDLFKKAIVQVHLSPLNEDIRCDPNITLLDIVRLHNKRFDDITKLVFLSYNRHTSKEYNALILDKYIRLGGNIHVIVFGFIEYLLTMHNPTSKVMEAYLHNMSSNTSLRLEILLAKEKAMS